MTFQAALPPGADQERGIISTTRLEASQTLEPLERCVEVGDALKRSISLRAAAISGMAFAPVQYIPVAGVGLYPGEPVVQDAVDRGSLDEGLAHGIGHLRFRTGRQLRSAGCHRHLVGPWREASTP